MPNTQLRKLKSTDIHYFSLWWRNKSLLRLTSGMLKRISDKEIDAYFQAMMKNKNDHHFMILLDKQIIGHIALAKRRNDWYETQIVIGEKKFWGKGHGTEAIRHLLRKAKRFKIKKIYLEVRPTNIRAIRAYTRCGFKKVRTILYPSNRHLPNTVRMELFL